MEMISGTADFARIETGSGEDLVVTHTLKNVQSDVTVTATYKGQPHQWETDYVISKPLCDQVGYIHRHCTVCGWGENDPAVTEATAESYLAKGTVAEVPDPDYVAHGHEFALYDQKAATCTSKGSAGRLVCSKCFKYAKCANGHVVALADAADGNCTTCGEKLNPDTNYLSPDGKHNFNVYQETLADGGKVYKCAYCDRTVTKYEIEAGVTLTAVPQVNATCLEAGHILYFIGESTNTETGETVTVKYFLRDGTQKVMNDADLVLAKLDHNYGAPLAAAAEGTCTANGYAAGAEKCSLCGYTKAVVEAYEAALDEGEAPTKAGLEAYAQAHPADMVLPEGHKFEAADALHAAVAATCTEAGSIKYYTCDKCGKDLQELTQAVGENDVPVVVGYKELADGEWIVKAKGHTFPEGTTRTYKAPSCTEDGGFTYSAACTVCGLDWEKTADALGHNMQAVAAKAATCTEAGNTAYYKCSRCGRTTSDEAGETVIAAEAYVLEKLGHDDPAAETQAVEATCTSKGNVKYYTCSKCGKTFEDAACTKEITDVTTPMKDHETEETKTKGANCQTKGDLIIKCKNCDYEVKKTGKGEKGDHSWGSKNTPATCTATGLAWEECSVCGQVKDKETLSALGHAMTEWADAGNGKEERHCTRCDYSETRDKADDGSGSGSSGEETPTATGERCPKCGFNHANRTGIFVEDGLYCRIVSFFRRILSIFRK